MQRVLIIGATSAIAEATARLYAERGARLHLVSRNTARLKAIADDLLVRGAPEVTHAPLDVNDLKAHPAILDEAWLALGEVNVVVIAHGTLPNQKACQDSVDITLAEFSTNAISTLALLTIIANRLEQAGHGTIATITSVAGDRGRSSNYVYGSAKAAVSTFLSGLRQRLSKKGISVIDVRPGFVDTPMTHEFKKGALWASPDTIARGIVSAADKGRSVVYLPSFWYIIMTVIRAIPEFLFKRITL